MRKGWVIALLSLLLVTALLFCANQVQASKGVPGSAEFGYGTILDPNFTGKPLGKAFTITLHMNPDWVYVPVDWAKTYPEPGKGDFKTLDQVMQFASRNDISIAISLQHAPDYALTDVGPDEGQTTELVNRLITRYPEQIAAIELFPRANTRQGWGRNASPQGYVSLLKSVSQELSGLPNPPLLVAGGLQPLAVHPQKGDMNDLEFLQGIYKAGGKPYMPILSLQFVQITAQPLLPASDSDPFRLRHYEQVRRIMVANGHANGMLWVTHLGIPAGMTDENEQTVWLRNVYSQLRAQLYMGMAFLQSSTPSTTPASPMISIIKSDGSYHPFYAAFQGMTQAKTDALIERPGHVKTNVLIKDRSGN